MPLIYIKQLRLVVHLACLAVLAVVLYAKTPAGNYAFLLPILFMFFSALTARMYRQLSEPALIADIVASIALTCSISLMFMSEHLGGDLDFLTIIFLVIGVVAIAIQIRINAIESRKVIRNRQ